MSDFEEWAYSRASALLDNPTVSPRNCLIQMAREAYERGKADQIELLRQAEKRIMEENKPAKKRLTFTEHLENYNKKLSDCEAKAIHKPLGERLASSLTVRERFAMAAMQGYRSSNHLEAGPTHIAKLALMDADALIAELEKGKA